MCVACELCGERTVWWSSLQPLEGTGTGMQVSGCCSKFRYLLSHLASQFSLPCQFLCTCVCICVGTFLSHTLIYGDKVSHWTWSSLFGLVCLATCSGDPIPAFFAWPLKVDHCALAFLMGSGALNFCLHLAWQCFTHWVISQHHLKTLWTLKGELQKKGDVWQSESTKARYRGKKITPRKWFVTTALNYIFMFPKVEEIQVLHVPAKGSWPVGLSCVLPRMVMGAEWPAGILILGSTVQAGATSMLISTFFGILGLHVWLIFRISNRVGRAVGNHIQEVASRLSGSPGQGKAMLT